MATQDDVRRIALALPEVREAELGFSFEVAGKGMTWPWRERVHPRKPKVPNPQVLVIPVLDLEEKAALLGSDDRVFFTEPHYDGYKAVLVRLPEVSLEQLEELLTDAWRCKAPKALLAQHDR